MLYILYFVCSQYRPRHLAIVLGIAVSLPSPCRYITVVLPSPYRHLAVASPPSCRLPSVVFVLAVVYCCPHPRCCLAVVPLLSLLSPRSRPAVVLILAFVLAVVFLVLVAGIVA